ncbi:hypothetical protein MSG28_011859 [Choristoneura fumiferana]|uniref:Uncharacterized protein n=1 Tax=Choristoneura fumiferana TaxID=7141 RepID=A0ACC0KM22_CHOFU|nr:hypothetical protein MSG28_011859 [Choristoneura fumiferana]
MEVCEDEASHILLPGLARQETVLYRERQAIHLEADPSDYLAEEGIKSNEARLEIIHKILGDILDLHVRDPREITQLDYTRGFFLGNHVKLSLVEGWRGEGGTQSLGELTVQWCLRGEAERNPPSATFLPVHVYDCPEHFSTVEYFDNLTSTSLGRLVVYSDVLTTTNAVTRNVPLAHGVACVARRMTSGQGRGQNVWRRMSATLPLVQHAAALAAVRAVRALPAYEHLDIRKYKLSSLISPFIGVNSSGTAVNISNTVPTTCLNQIIEEHNKQHDTNLPPITIEKFLARYCSQLERILDYIDSDGGVDAFREQYYQYWLHDNESIRVRQEGSAQPVAGVIAGVDEAGWLRVRTAGGDVRVAPDGNTFDLMSGLVAPKF